MKKYPFLCVFLLLAVNLVVIAQVPKDSPLYRQLKIQDSIFFERSFNQCDFSYLENAIDSGLRFYHDRSGVQNREQFLENTRKYICGDAIRKPIRKADENSLEVFPLYNNNILYGVVQTGNHRFYIREKNKPDVLTGKAKFIHLYLLVNDQWILKEVISFEHQSPG